MSHDTRTLRAENLYVAIRGDRFDGHAFVEDAFARGAAGCVVDAAYAAETAAGPLLVVDDPRIALGRMASGYRAQHGARLVGVTGSAGKTTVVAMLAGIVSQVFPTATTLGNWNNDIGLPLSLLNMDSADEIGIFEVASNHPGEIASLCRILKPDVGLLTNIGLAHMEFFDDIEAVAREKAALLEALPSDGSAVIVGDAPFASRLREVAPCAVTTVACAGDADYMTTLPDSDGSVEIREKSSGESLEVRLLIPGRHSALNATMAAAAGRLLNVPWEAVESGLKSFVPCPMRWETVDLRGVTVINDAYNANPLSMRAALQAFATLSASGRKWLVLGDMRELGESALAAHASLGEEIARADWPELITIGEQGAGIGRAAQGVESTSIRVRICDESSDAAAILKDEARSGDAVLLKASRAVQLESIIDLLLA
ncbi:MAG: UDP-N-acetylmuramoyl-tripeptide--D-alanyl-D-alanine ligase [Verrucomicrobia bacterium]|nr:UDP-N-acetylmuramoyl-tripeptide--D-alanyl-D-alanine ligase [Verrucomicrobiota bacterium]MDA1085824.1 UDP-N-acetylmuramoyl-tripeptide--D-alanyl-D-alanine ligase [Verrucomicrobiota bacterium]